MTRRLLKLAFWCGVFFAWWLMWHLHLEVVFAMACGLVAIVLLAYVQATQPDVVGHRDRGGHVGKADPYREVFDIDKESR